MKKVGIALSLVVLLGIGVLAQRRLVMGPASGLGVKAKALADCPGSPNCVSTAATDEGHRVEPLALEGDPAEAMAKLRQVIEQMPRTRIADATEHYLHAEATSQLWGYVDDLEVWIDQDGGKIHLRSASRTGHSDMGVNRRRVEALVAGYQENM